MKLYKPLFERGPPIFVIAGYATVVFFTIVWIAASIIDGRWIFGDDLSHMGTCQVANAEIIFNYGCVITGVFGCSFGYGMAKYNTGWRFLSGCFTFLSPIFLMGVGAINENYGFPHQLVTGLFAAFAIGAFVTSLPTDFMQNRPYSIFTVLLLAIMGGSMLAFEKFGIYEAIVVICILVWIALQSYKYSKVFGKVDYVDPVREKFPDVELVDSPFKKILRK